MDRVSLRSSEVPYSPSGARRAPGTKAHKILKERRREKEEKPFCPIFSLLAYVPALAAMVPSTERIWRIHWFILHLYLIQCARPRAVQHTFFLLLSFLHTCKTKNLRSISSSRSRSPVLVICPYACSSNCYYYDLY